MKAIIVGAGAAGLASAIRLAAAGVEVEIFEKTDRPGGKMNLIEGKGYRFDLGPTIVMMPHIYREVFEAAGKDPEDYIQMKQLNPIYALQFSETESVKVSTELAEFTKFLESISYEDTLGYLKYMADIYERYLIAKEHFIEKSFHGPGDFYNPHTLFQALKLKTFDSAYHSISRYVKDERLRKLLSFQTLYIGVSPYNGPSIYTIIPMIEMIYGVWFIKGGMYTMVEGMVKLCSELGVKIHCNQEVEEILIENSQVKGVRIGKESHSADQVLCNADFPYAVKHLIKDAGSKGKYAGEKIDKMDYSCSCILLYLGLDCKLPELEVHNIQFAKDFDKNIADIFGGRLPEDPSMYFYCPTKMDPSLAPDGGEALYVLVPVPNLKNNRNLYEASSIKAYREKLMGKIKTLKGLEDADKHIVFEEMRTPMDFEIQLNAYNGATFGLAPTLLQSNYFRPHNQSSSCRGLFFAGSSVHPGAGVPIVLTSAKLAVQDMLSAGSIPGRL